MRSPELTEARCNACTVMGGTVVQNEKDATFYGKQLRRPIEPGEVVELEPCIQKGLLRIFPEEYGRPCPRVQLAVRNVEAQQLAACLIREDTRPTFALLFERLCGVYPQAEQLQIVQRVNAALASPAYNDAFKHRLKGEA